MKRCTARGSIIAFSIILLAILLTAGLSVASVASLEKRSSLATEKSVVAFQAADSGTERVLERIYKGNSPSLTSVDLEETMPDATLQQVATNLDGVSGGATCNTSTNKITATNTENPRYTFQISFFDGSDNQITCNDTAWRDKVVRIRTEGFFRETARVLELGIKPRPLCDPTVSDGTNVYDVLDIGGRCWTKQSMRVGTRIGSGTPQSNNGTIEFYCYNNNSSNCTMDHPYEPDGGLYTWDEAMQYVTTEGAQGICPAGWHIPSDGDWNALASAISPTDSSVAVPWSLYGWRGLAPVEVGTALKPDGSTKMNMNLGGFFGLSGFVGRDTGVANFHTSTESSAVSAVRIGVRDSQVGIARDTVQKAVYANFVRCVMD